MLKEVCFVFLLQKILRKDARMVIHFKRSRWIFLVWLSDVVPQSNAD